MSNYYKTLDEDFHRIIDIHVKVRTGRYPQTEQQKLVDDAECVKRYERLKKAAKIADSLLECSEQIQEDMICLIDSKEFVVGQLEAILKDALCEIVVSNFERLEVEK